MQEFDQSAPVTQLVTYANRVLTMQTMVGDDRWTIVGIVIETHSNEGVTSEFKLDYMSKNGRRIRTFNTVVNLPSTVLDEPFVAELARTLIIQHSNNSFVLADSITGRAILGWWFAVGRFFRRFRSGE